MKTIKNYEAVIGLEVHAELDTKTKIFCSCPTGFGAEPNTHVCPVCLGLPGVLPVLNRKVVEYAVKAGIATNCKIARHSIEDRKNYFYPDLPKAYQISQYDLPLCKGGFLRIETEEGEKTIGITRIHIEEDAGKLIHDRDFGTMIDCNRCGVPLIEIVSEPDMRSAEEVRAYLEKLRATLMYTGVSTCRMNEGAFRCDVNLSIRKTGESVFGTRTEMKNLNSFQFVVKAIEYEYRRQVELVETGKEVVQETRRFDPESGKTFPMRTKEDANDYRYFPDPDLPPIDLSDEQIEKFASEIPELPDSRKRRYMKKFGISSYTSEKLIGDPAVSDYFEEATKFTRFPKSAANLIEGEIMHLNESDHFSCRIRAEHLGKLADLEGEGAINSSTVKKLILRMWETDFDPLDAVEKEGLRQINDPETLSRIADEVVNGNEKLVSDFRNGKEHAIKALMGQGMGKTAGKANPVLLEKYIREKLTGSTEERNG